nr:BRO family protein [Variovorax sp. PBL-E5]
MNLRALVRDGEPWFLAKDVCDALGLTDTNKALKGLDPEERDYINIAEVIKKAGTNKRLIGTEP